MTSRELRMRSACAPIRAIGPVPSIPVWKTLTQMMERLRRQLYILIPSSDLQIS